MEVRIVEFPETRVAAIEHFGSPATEHDTVHKLIAWKLQHRLLDPARNRSYGVHYTDPSTVDPAEHHAMFCLSVDCEVEPNEFGIVSRIIPANRCAVARDIGSRLNNRAAPFLVSQWLPQSGEALGDFPIFFHYVNVGPAVKPEEMLTDVYLPLRRRE